MRFVFALCLMILSSAPAAAEKNNVLDVQAFTTPAGIAVWLVEDRSTPVISMTFSFDGGLGYEDAGKPGVARLVSILLDEGAGDIREEEFQKRLSDNAIQMGFSPGRDAFYGQVRTLSENRALAFDLLKLALTAPRFDADAVERMKNANSAKIRRDLGDPSWVVTRAFNGMVFEGHAYSTPGFGTLDSMRAITRDDLLSFVKAQFARDVLKVAIAGDITRKEAAELVDKTFTALPEKAKEPHTVPAVAGYAGKTILVGMDTPQTYVIAATEGIRRADDDWHAAVIINHILGGGDFDSRLMRDIREKRGLTYGIYSSLHSMRLASLLQASFSASNEKVAEAIEALRAQWRMMAEKGPTARELENAKAYLTGSLMLELTSTAAIADTLNGLMREGLPPDYINRRNDYLNAVTPDAARRAARRLMQPDALRFILVGKPQGLRPDILLERPPGIGSADPVKDSTP